MTYDIMLSQMLSKSKVMSMICSREFLSTFLYWLYIAWLSSTILEHTYLLYYILCFVLMIWDSLWSSFDGSLPIDFSSLFRKMIFSSTLDLTCLNYKFFAFNDRFTSLTFDWIIPLLFDFHLIIDIHGLCLLYLEIHCPY